jgi:hypothetical protein
MLIGDGEPLNVPDHIKEPPWVSCLPGPAEQQADAVLAAQQVERLDLVQAADHHRVGGEHGIVAASGDRLHQGGQLAALMARRAVKPSGMCS